MAATVRIARVVAASASVASSAASLTSTGHLGGGATVRIAAVSAVSQQSLATVRVAGVTATTGTGTSSSATVRIADVTAYAVQTAVIWNGTTWQPVTPGGQSAMTARSQGSVAIAVTVTAASRMTVHSVGAGTFTASGTLALSGGGTLTVSGAVGGPTVKSGSISLTGGGTLALSGTASGPIITGPVTIIPDPANDPPRMLIDLTGFSSATATITRIDIAGNRSPVRLGNPATLDAGTWTGYDYEAPYGQPVTYEVAAGSLTVTSDPAALTVTRPWLVHPGIPDLSQPIVIRSIGDRSRTANQGVFLPIGRATALTRSDGVRRAPTFELVLKTSTDDEYAAMETLLADASTLLLQTAFTFTDRSNYEWVSIGDVTDTPVSKNYGDAETFWTLPCTVTDAPEGLLQSQRTLADLAAEFSTLGEIAANYATLRDVAVDNLIGS